MSRCHDVAFFENSAVNQKYMSSVVTPKNPAEFAALQPKIVGSPAILYFYAEWYEPCQAASTVVQALAQEYPNMLFVVRCVVQIFLLDF
jgi:thiol-disulfide isomerase/thioredoxin